MAKQKNNPYDGLILDNYEQEIENHETDSYDKVFTLSKKDKEDFANIAKKHSQYRVSQRINIRINNQDLAKVKSKAKDNNIPYQTLISAVVHKYANGDLKVSL